MKCSKCEYENMEGATHCDLCKEVLINSSVNIMNQQPMSEQQKMAEMIMQCLKYSYENKEAQCIVIFAKRQRSILCA